MVLLLRRLCITEATIQPDERSHGSEWPWVIYVTDFCNDNPTIRGLVNWRMQSLQVLSNVELKRSECNVYSLPRVVQVATHWI